MGKRKIGKHILTGNEAKKKIVSGAMKLDNIIRKTIGPMGTNVIIDVEEKYPLITNDGATIAREIFLTDPFEEMGLRLIKEASLKTNDIAGDGTTSACIIACAILKEAKKYLYNKKYAKNVLKLKEELHILKDEVIDFLLKIKREVQKKEEIYEISYIASGNEKIAKILSDIYEEDALSSAVIEESNNKNITYEIREGFVIDSGYINRYMVKNEEKKMTQYLNPYIILYGKKLESLKEILPLLELVKKENKPIVIIAKDYSKEAEEALGYNALNGILDIVAIKPCIYGKESDEILKDIAVITESKIFLDELDEDFSLTLINEVQKVISFENKTHFIYNIEKKENLLLKERLLSLEKELELSNEVEKEYLTRRVRNFKGKTAEIFVGANSTAEKRDIFLKSVDALYSAIGAKEEGIMPGAGKGYILASLFLNENIRRLKKEKHKYSKNEYIVKMDALKILANSLKEPFYAIVENCGLNRNKIYNELLKSSLVSTKNIVFDAKTVDYVDCYEKGIIDSYKVQSTAITSAIDVSKMILTTDAAMYKMLDIYDE